MCGGEGEGEGEGAKTVTLGRYQTKGQGRGGLGKPFFKGTFEMYGPHIKRGGLRWEAFKISKTSGASV